MRTKCNVTTNRQELNSVSAKRCVYINIKMNCVDQSNCQLRVENVLVKYPDHFLITPALILQC